VVLQQVVINTADEVTGKVEGMVRNGWFDEECT
jgi:hypothetical protein